MKLFSYRLRGFDASRKSLFVRAEEGKYDCRTGSLSAGQTLTTDTYFGCFSAAVYKRYTIVKSVAARLEYSGEGNALLVARLPDGSETTLCQSELRGENAVASLQFDVPDAEECICFLKITAKSGLTLHSGGYYADAPARTVKIAAVICSYRREHYVNRNMTLAANELLGGDSIEFFIVDNGNTLKGMLPESDKIHLFYNKNCGGSGGFTRGLIEVLARKDEFTHVLMMDDDIEFDPFTIEKTVAFLSLLRPEHSDAHIGGGMLKLDAPCIQHEAGAVLEGNLLHPLRSCDLSFPDSLFFNDRAEKADYGAWWYLVMPIGVVTPQSLPLPLFIKYDDVEYGVRNINELICFNGIGVWHESFNLKYSSYLEYYSIRNGLIVAALKDDKRVFGRYRFYLKRMLRMLISDIPDPYLYPKWATEDFLKGPEFLMNVEPEELNNRLREKTFTSVRDVSGTQLHKLRLLLPYILTKSFYKVLFCSFTLWNEYKKNYKSAADAYRARFAEMSSAEFWRKYLGL